MAVDLQLELRRAFIAAGIRADDAATAASVADSLTRERRDSMILAALDAGISMRDAARLWGLTKSTVDRVQKQRAGRDCPAPPDSRDTPRIAAQIAAERRGKLGDHPSRLVGMRDAAAFVALKPRAFQQRVRAGDIPAPVRVSEGRIAWRLRDLVAWVEARPVVLASERADPEPQEVAKAA